MKNNFKFLRFVEKLGVIIEIIVKKMSKIIDDKTYLTILYGIRFKRKLNLSNPQSFNEKLTWLKLNDRNPLYTRLADKYEVKKFVANIIGEEYVVPCIGVWNSIEDIDFSMLPDQFVLKGTHDSSGAFIVKKKELIDMDAIVKKFNPILKRNYFWGLREWPYKNILPRIIVDTYLDDGTAGDRSISLRDYKFWCFNGVPKYMYLTVKDKNIYENFYDREFNPVKIDHGFPRNIPEFEKPKNFEKMWELAGILAKASLSKFVRIDFFNVNGKIYFGEFTFYDWGGLRPFADYQQDLELGQFINI